MIKIDNPQNMTGYMHDMMFMNVDVCFFVKCISSKNMTKCVYIYISFNINY